VQNSRNETGNQNQKSANKSLPDRQTEADGWRGVQAREQVIKAALYEVLKVVDEVERIFLIIKAQGSSGTWG